MTHEQEAAMYAAWWRYCSMNVVSLECMEDAQGAFMGAWREACGLGSVVMPEEDPFETPAEDDM